ncbi:hypothetical protein UFOVP398_53 [uncultured Caudovirales phage]|uniref:Uncharacterized protein n=1 Tax=uncultured Caudovirales phage TaxID=2100421 RepID=A0A6J5M559_9CAUD|nr:hypothetical protein UFOVP398_53 [uncultured Caudovirales phage]
MLAEYLLLAALAALVALGVISALQEWVKK